jgi:MFS family permease
MTMVSMAPFAPAAAPQVLPTDDWRGWLVAAGGFVCLLFSVGVLVVYSFGVLGPAMGNEFGWSNIERSTLFLAFSLSSVVAGPIWGAIADRIGAKKVVIVSIILLALCFAAMSRLPNDLIVAQLGFAMIGLLGGGTLPPTYASLVVSWFERYRGLALGLSLLGVGMGAALMPTLAAKIVTLYGWREVCLAYAGMILVIALPAASLMLRVYPEPLSQRRTLAPSVGTVVSSSMREPRMWILVGFAFLTGLVLVGNVTTLVPLLQSRGESLVDSAKYQSILGLSLVFGRLAGGALLDRIFAPRVVTGILMITGAGFLMLYAANSPAAYVLAAIGIGMAIGMEIDFLAFIVSRYYVRSAFTTIYAMLFAVYSLGASSGAPAMAWMHRASGGYGNGLLVSAGLIFALSMLMFALPRYEAQK